MDIGDPTEINPDELAWRPEEPRAVLSEAQTCFLQPPVIAGLQSVHLSCVERGAAPHGRFRGSGAV